MKKIRTGLKDVWNAFMCQGAKYGAHDIPFCPTTTNVIPSRIITWSEAKAIYRKNYRKDKKFFYDAFVCFYEDDQKFDGSIAGIWRCPHRAISVLKHFSGLITPDFSTYQDFPYPVKLFNTFRMRAFGYWCGRNGLQVINNVRWGTKETFEYCFEGVPSNSIIAIGTVGGSPRKIVDRTRFEEGLTELIKRLAPHTILIYGSSNYRCIEELRQQGITIIAYPSKTAQEFERRKGNE